MKAENSSHRVGGSKKMLSFISISFLTTGIFMIGFFSSVSATTEKKPVQEAMTTADHSTFDALNKNFKSGPEVTAACLSCHTEAAKQLQESIHFSWEFHDKDGKLPGKKTVINNFCVGVTSNEPRCTSCHAGYGWSDQSFNFNKENSVDCLVCHDTSGKYSKFPTAAGHPLYEPKKWQGKLKQPVNLREAALSAGMPDRENCGSCHFYGGGGDGVKHGDLDSSLTNPSKELDVHMSPDGKNFSCTDCHVSINHQISGSHYQMTARDTTGKDPARHKRGTNTCESCHGLTPHGEEKLNHHVARVSCQACHIPTFARELPTKMTWDWSTAGKKKDGKPYKEKGEFGKPVYDTKKGNFTWGKNVVPEYIWFNGKFDAITLENKIDPTQTPVPVNQPGGSYDDPESRLWPMKIHYGKQAYDTVHKNLVLPKLFGKKGTDAFWKKYDWAKSFEAGMKEAGIEYSGKFDWIETSMYWPITHMVAPAEKSVSCSECHSQNGRLQKVQGFYLPGRDRVWPVEAGGWTLVLITIAGVFWHAGKRYLSNRSSK